MIVQQIFLQCASTNLHMYLELSVFDVSEKMPFGSNDVEKESAANSIVITPPKNREVSNALDTVRRRLQCEGAAMDTFFC